jgi:hypothetical protein
MARAGITRGGNYSGTKGSKGGKLSRGRMLAIDFSNFAEYADKLDKLGADLQKVIGDAMERAAETVQEDTIEALADAYLPAGGKYHGKNRDTEDSVIRNPKVKWHGSLGEVELGFDKTKPGAGGFLITGTPRMKPDYKLEDMYSRKKYLSQITRQIKNDLQKAIDERMGG